MLVFTIRVPIVNAGRKIEKTAKYCVQRGGPTCARGQRPVLF